MNWLWLWRRNFLGPAWLRRARTAWVWYRSGNMMISEDDVKYLLNSQRERIEREKAEYMKGGGS